VPTIRELSAPYENFMLSPRLGRGVCSTCFNFTDGYESCYACAHCEHWLERVAPISYSVAREQLHHALAAYKRVRGDVARQLAVELAAVLWRYLIGHERCVARAAGLDVFELVTTVPSGDRGRDGSHPLRWIVGEVVGATRSRHQRLLTRSQHAVDPREFSAKKYLPRRALRGESVLLIDDTWTTGANAQSAAAALKAAGAGPVAAVVIGRHLNRGWHQNDLRLRGLAPPFDWEHCALCGPG
jgi:predicted amidophosphoribosyltransferase